ncbi:MAG: D-glycerate dehydrogenase [Betaproteobacteria bacterium]|nr:D-glycerate dehydrogenase [Betaproteobacteria bacterium]
MRPRVYVTQPIAPSALNRLQALADVTLNPDPLHIASKDELLSAARGHDIIFCLLHDKLDAQVINANPKLKAIASMTITPADIDTQAASARKLPVTVIPALLLNDATADLAFALLLATVRRVAEGDRVMRGGVFPGSQSNYVEGGTVSRKTIGLLGVGGVGTAMAQRARGFAMKIIYYDPRRLSPEQERELGATWVPFEQLFRDADFVSIHVNLNPQTRHVVDAQALALMKPSAYLINSARGPLVDELALVQALKEKRIAGAGLDVFEHEPKPHPELLKMNNVVCTPHMGSAVRELREAMANVVVDNIVAIIEGRRPPNCWNAEIYG